MIVVASFCPFVTRHINNLHTTKLYYGNTVDCAARRRVQLVASSGGSTYFVVVVVELYYYNFTVGTDPLLLVNVVLVLFCWAWPRVCDPRVYKTQQNIVGSSFFCFFVSRG